MTNSGKSGGAAAAADQLAASRGGLCTSQRLFHVCPLAEGTAPTTDAIRQRRPPSFSTPFVKNRLSQTQVLRNNAGTALWGVKVIAKNRLLRFLNDTNLSQKVDSSDAR